MREKARIDLCRTALSCLRIIILPKFRWAGVGCSYLFRNSAGGPHFGTNDDAGMRDFVAAL
jgi:hypothetical protein